MKDRVELGSEREGRYMESCTRKSAGKGQIRLPGSACFDCSAKERERGRKHTILHVNPRPDSPSHLVNHDVPHTILPPLSEDIRNLLSSFHFGDLETHNVDSGFDS